MGRKFVGASPQLILPAGAVAGDVLTADASGNATWVAPSGGGGSGVPPGMSITTPVSFANVSTLVMSYPQAGVTAGMSFQYWIKLLLTNPVSSSTTYTTTIWINGTNSLLSAQFTTGTVARAAPGGVVQIDGRITFLSATSGEALMQMTSSSGTAFNVTAGTTAAVTIPVVTSIQFFLNSGISTTTSVVRQAGIYQIH